MLFIDVMSVCLSIVLSAIEHTQLVSVEQMVIRHNIIFPSNLESNAIHRRDQNLGIKAREMIQKLCDYFAEPLNYASNRPDEDVQKDETLGLYPTRYVPYVFQ